MGMFVLYLQLIRRGTADSRKAGIAWFHAEELDEPEVFPPHAQEYSTPEVQPSSAARAENAENTTEILESSGEVGETVESEVENIPEEIGEELEEKGETEESESEVEHVDKQKTQGKRTARSSIDKDDRSSNRERRRSQERQAQGRHDRRDTERRSQRSSSRNGGSRKGGSQDEKERRPQKRSAKSSNAKHEEEEEEEEDEDVRQESTVAESADLASSSVSDFISLEASREPSPPRRSGEACATLFQGEDCDSPVENLPECIQGVFRGWWTFHSSVLGKQNNLSVPMAQGLAKTYGQGPAARRARNRRIRHLTPEHGLENATQIASKEAYEKRIRYSHIIVNSERQKQVSAVDIFGQRGEGSSGRFLYERCAVVGSSANMMGAPAMGDTINEHDVVMRFNNAPVVGYEKHVGNFTTVRLTNGQYEGVREFAGEPVVGKWTGNKEVRSLPHVVDLC
ncbi:hypothetical protein CYMTET_29197 [Cymbomonas tetramitiformis]|uniref:beta-galactoside alpha-(2,6)-sialyltransferase n=1 Tax=Cymbomonas tetramitiformis TaxID=36881 RepID=A0AAE0FLI1_9CHLO|nr:hypothetical protein CYMTET_29197 [Cymbomonas tetramitiformis]